MGELVPIEPPVINADLMGFDDMSSYKSKSLGHHEKMSYTLARRTQQHLGKYYDGPTLYKLAQSITALRSQQKPESTSAKAQVHLGKGME